MMNDLDFLKISNFYCLVLILLITIHQSAYSEQKFVDKIDEKTLKQKRYCFVLCGGQRDLEQTVVNINNNERFSLGLL